MLCELKSLRYKCFILIAVLHCAESVYTHEKGMNLKVAKENSLADAVVGRDLCPFYAPQTLAILRQKADYCPWGALNKQYFLPKLAFVGTLLKLHGKQNYTRNLFHS